MSPPPSDHGDIATMRFEEYIVDFSFAFLFISVTGYGDILPARFEESPSLPAGLPRHLSQLVMATFSLSSTYGVGYGYCGPVRFEDYISTYPSLRRPPHVHWLRWWHRTCALRGAHRRHSLHAYLCISTPPSYIYAATIYWSTCTWSVSSSPSTGAPGHSRTVAIEIVTAEEF